MISALETSPSFARTHDIIAELLAYSTWTKHEKEWLFDIGANNSQVYYILNDLDVKRFYNKLIHDFHDSDANLEKIKDSLQAGKSSPK